MKKVITLSILVMIVLSGCDQADDHKTNVTNSSGDSTQGATLFAQYNCSGCHGADGKTPALGVSRIIADIKDVRDVENALFTLRDAPTAQRDINMINAASSLSDEDITSLSAFIGTL
ncbi:MAG: c-type cytochrome [Epsilonproteobacteria bacterium]|nr:c-type cytochrome [Campylobacterota bacterium]